MPKLTNLIAPLLLLSTKASAQEVCTNSKYILSRQASIMSGNSNEYEGMGSQGPQQPQSVLGQALKLFSTKPMTGYYRDGYCRVGNEDPGNHSVAGVVSDEFLDYSASKGNDLRQVGLTGGCKWCLCSSRWQQALDAFRKGEVGKEAVPRIHLDATHDAALKGGDVTLKDLKEFAVDK